MKNNFRGWKTVFDFTFQQASKGTAFRIVTTLVALVIIGCFIVINVIVAKPEDNEPEASPIQTVYVLDESGLQPTDYKVMNPELSTEPYGHAVIENISGMSRKEVIELAAVNSPQSIAVIISKLENSYELEAAIPEGSLITQNQAQAILIPIQSAFAANKLMQAGLTPDQLTVVMRPVINYYNTIGEETSGLAMLIKYMAPMLFGLVLYFMLFLYGQTISKSVSAEKTSKLMETILTSIHPYALITGKVLATTFMAVLQFVIWIGAGIAGLYGGNMVAQHFYPEYENSVVTIINFLKDNLGETAMTAPAIIMAILVFAVGFLFYSLIAGLAGSMVAKPEDVANTQAIFIFPVLISFLVSYLAPVMGNDSVIQAVRLIPFTIPFCVPAELISGTIGLVQGGISLAILGVFCLLFVMLSGKLYKGLVLYTGQKISLQLMVNVLRAKE